MPGAAPLVTAMRRGPGSAFSRSRSSWSSDQPPWMRPHRAARMPCRRWADYGRWPGTGLAGRRHNPAMPQKRSPHAVPCDYDRDPDRFRTARAASVATASRLTCTNGSPAACSPRERRPCSTSAAARVSWRATCPMAPGSGSTARRRCWPGHRSRTWSGDAAALPCDDRSFDSAALLYVLYHLSDPAQALAEAHRVLRPGGLVASEPPRLTRARPRALARAADLRR
jgi:SAM-dependent methyltransferase